MRTDPIPTGFIMALALRPGGRLHGGDRGGAKAGWRQHSTIANSPACGTIGWFRLLCEICVGPNGGMGASAKHTAIKGVSGAGAPLLGHVGVLGSRESCFEREGHKDKGDCLRWWGIGGNCVGVCVGDALFAEHVGSRGAHGARAHLVRPGQPIALACCMGAPFDPDLPDVVVHRP